MNYPLYVLFGLTPSVLWLLFFLRKDSHPESNATILKIFFYGILAAIPAALVEIGFLNTIKSLPMPLFYIQTIYIFLGIGLTEEFFKYLVVRQKIMKNSALDEPVDLMLFMIIAALGFAALENLLFLLPLANPFMFVETMMMASFRFVGATFLHALASGLIGYFMAVGLCGAKRKRFMMFALGITLASFLHGLYDFSIIEIEGKLKFAIPLFILISLTIFVTWGFTKVKKLKSTCNL